MIQRKQSLWLFIAALLNAGVFYFDLYRYHNTVRSIVKGVDTVTDTTGQIRVADHFPTLLIALVMTLLPVVIIFMFNNRKRQIRMCFVSILAIASFITIALQRVKHLGNLTPPPSSESYWIGSVLPIAAVIFIIMAMIAIRKDERLVKSVDRLR